MQVNGRVKISKEEIPGSKCSIYGYILTYSRLPTAGSSVQYNTHGTFSGKVAPLSFIMGQWHTSSGTSSSSSSWNMSQAAERHPKWQPSHAIVLPPVSTVGGTDDDDELIRLVTDTGLLLLGQVCHLSGIKMFQNVFTAECFTSYFRQSTLMGNCYVKMLPPSSSIRNPATPLFTEVMIPRTDE